MNHALSLSRPKIVGGGIYNSGYGKIAGASPLQFSGELLETGASIILIIHTDGGLNFAGDANFRLF